jgi:hypothetical protein
VSLTRLHGWILSLVSIMLIGLALMAGEAAAAPGEHAHDHEQQLDGALASEAPGGTAKHDHHGDKTGHCWAHATCSPVTLPAFLDPVGRHVAIAWPADEAVDLVSLAFQPLDPPPRS